MPEKKTKILIAPLNWGLGHASRMIPIIRCFEENNCEVIIAVSHQTKNFIINEFPNVRTIQIRSSVIKYTHNSMLMPKLFLQAPGLLKDMLFEKKWIKNFTDKENPDLIISDNRFGLAHKKVKSVYITHQINVILPGYMKIFQPLVRKLHRKIISGYDICLIPDNKHNDISGILSHKKSDFSFNHKYIGVLSGFIGLKNESTEEIPDVLAVVSGPEPQRKILVNTFIKIFKNDKRKIWIIAGQPEKSYDKNNGKIRIISHLKRSKLKYLMEKVPVLVTRSGYTTLMDLYVIQRKAILIPTPGQTEQEYLAEYFKNKFSFKTTKQNNISHADDFIKAHCGKWDSPSEQSIAPLCEILNF